VTSQPINTMGTDDGAWFVVYRMPGRMSAFPIRWQGWVVIAAFVAAVTVGALGSGLLWHATRNVAWFIGFFVTLFPASFIALFALINAKGRSIRVPLFPAWSEVTDQAQGRPAAAVPLDPRLTLQAIDHAQVAIPPGGEDDARAFYKDLLGLPEQPKPLELAKRGGAWFESRAVKVHCGVEDPFTPAKKAHIAFRVNDVASLASRARAAGYEVVDDDLLAGHERIYIYDPFGNRLEFLKPLESGG
jgi:catechol 2,3-dioxygenase-like lactoylglutathione lyase family enzyme